MKLSWAVCHDDGSVKDWLWDRKPGGEVVLELNGPRTARVAVHAEEEVSQLIHPGRTRMKVWMSNRNATDSEKSIICNNLIVQPKATWDEVDIPSVDQSHRLLNAGHPRLYKKFPTGTENDFEDTGWDDTYELSEFMWRMIHIAGKRVRQLVADAEIAADSPTLGIIEGTLADTGITRTFKAADVRTTWDALVARSKRKNGPDFELNPLDRTDGVFAEFNTFHPQQGSDKTGDVIFEVGNTASDINWEPSIIDPPLCNRFIMIGAIPSTGTIAPCYVAEDKNSIEDLGEYLRIETAKDDETKIDELQARAEQYVDKHARPSDIFEIILPVERGGQAQGWARDANGNLVTLDSGEFGVPPAYGIDYELGDTVTVRVHDRFRFQMVNDVAGPGTDLHGRITKVTITEVDDVGTCVVALEMYQVEDTGGGATGYEAYIEVDNG